MRWLQKIRLSRRYSLLLYEFHTKPEGLRFIFKQVLKRYYRLVICLSPMLLLLVLCKDMGFYLALNHSNSVVLGVTQYILMLSIFLFGYRLSNDVIIAADKSYKDAIQESYRSAFMLIFTFVLIILCFIGMYNALVFVMRYFTPNNNYIASLMMVLLFFMSFPLLFLFTKFSQVPPLVMVDNYSIFDAIQVGPQLIKGNFVTAFKPIVFILIFYLFSGHSTKHAQYLYQHNLLIPFDYLSMLLVMPIFYGVALFSLSDFQLRDKLAGN